MHPWIVHMPSLWQCQQQTREDPGGDPSDQPRGNCWQQHVGMAPRLAAPASQPAWGRYSPVSLSSSSPNPAGCNNAREQGRQKRLMSICQAGGRPAGTVGWARARGIRAPDPIFAGICQLLGTKRRTHHVVECQEAQGDQGAVRARGTI